MEAKAEAEAEAEAKAEAEADLWADDSDLTVERSGASDAFSAAY